MMRNLAMTASIAAACLALGACGGGNETNTADSNASGGTGVVSEGVAEGGNTSGGASGDTSAAASFPKGARIVEENGKTYRIDADGTRVELTDADSRIVTEKGVRYRVDPGGARVRIDPQGAAIDVDVPDVDVDLPDVDVGINNKGNPDVDVKTKGDGDASPN